MLGQKLRNKAWVGRSRLRGLFLAGHGGYAGYFNEERLLYRRAQGLLQKRFDKGLDVRWLCETRGRESTSSRRTFVRDR